MFRKSMKMKACFIALLSFVFLSATAFGQTTGASLTGTVQDASGGVVQGATITVRNVDTGVETRATSNERGSYTFPSLQVGTYNMTAEASGFSRATRSDVRLNVGSQARLDITLVVAGTVTEVQVTGTAESVILEAGASTGTVLQEESLAAIPLLSGNVMDLINIMGGVTPITGDPVFSGTTQTFAGVSGNQVNVTRDGMSVTEVRNPTGVTAATNINTEMVGEFRMILSPVDAEMGRGAGQVQMTTRSGSNAYRGSVVWSNQNTVLDAVDFSVKQANTPKSWRNVNNYMLTASGPIVKNRTFFFATWEHQLALDKVVQNTKVLTPCARKGIFRYIEGYDNAPFNANQYFTPSSTGGNGTWPSVGGPTDGRPITVTGGAFINSNNPASAPQVVAPGERPMRIESVFGELVPSVRAALLATSEYNNPHGVYGDCGDIPFAPASNPSLSVTGRNVADSLYGSNYVLPGTYWGEDSGTGNWLFRNAYDPTGFVGRFTFGTEYNAGTVVMPPDNYYNGGDGLNVARYQWSNPIIGNGGSIYGTGGDPNRKSITVKLDHNISNDHRVSGTYTYETYAVHDAYRQWPEEFGGYPGTIDRKPQSLMVSLTSTLRPTLLNEARFGLSLSDTWTNNPYDTTNNGEKMRSVMESLLPKTEWAKGLPLVGIGNNDFFGSMGFTTEAWNSPSHPFGSRGNVPGTWGGSDPRWTIADTVTWMKGAHSFKGGIEYRRQSSSQEFVSNRGFMSGTSAMSDHVVVNGGLTAAAGNRRADRIPDNTSNPADSWYQMGDGFNNFLGMYTGNYGAALDLMSYFSGSIGRVSQYFYGVPDASSSTGSRWNDPANPDERLFVYDIANQELSLFFKDDWKVTNDLTLNLGVRYEYYGVPHTSNGMTLKIKGLSSENIFGVSQGGWDNWMTNRSRFYAAADIAPFTVISEGNGWDQDAVTEINVPRAPAPVTMYEYIGPGTSKSDVMAWHRDLNNFAPHLGFAWQLPWFGRGQTTLRGGWSISYSPVDNFNNYGVTIGDVGGISYQRDYIGEGSTTDPSSTNYYMDITDLGRSEVLNQSNGLLPKPDFILPLQAREVGMVTGSVGAMDENLRNPYTHSFNLSLTRNIGRNLTVDVRYIGTLGRAQLLGTNLNESNYIQTGLWQELTKIRQGGESALINSLIPQYTLIGNSMDWT
ncbi:MAG: TonB-dependent receptor, partial [Acidobacteria bacterium]|nr:TonB-dependent receptor [Acidobacteriota bacterium]